MTLPRDHPLRLLYRRLATEIDGDLEEAFIAGYEQGRTIGFVAGQHARDGYCRLCGMTAADHDDPPRLIPVGHDFAPERDRKPS